MYQTFESASTRDVVAARIKALRAWMNRAGIDAVLVPRSDEYQNEYVPPCAERLRWLTGFSGSAGIAAVTKKSAVLFTDGRYKIQAAAETDTDVVEVSMLPRLRLGEWLADTLAKGKTLGFDPKLHTATEITRLKAALARKGIKVKALAKNPIDALWGRERPKPPAGPVIVQPEMFAGVGVADKLTLVRKRLKEHGQSAVVLTLPDSICWLFNIRGSDVAHNPVVLAFAIVPATGKAEVFIDRAKIDSDVRAHLSATTRIVPPSDLAKRLAELRAAGAPVRVDPDTAAYWFTSKLGDKVVSRGEDPCILPKAIKSEAEISGSRDAHVRDGAAVVRFLSWLDDQPEGSVDEISAVRRLEDARRETNLLREISFPTISGSGPNGAIVHYRVTESTNRILGPGELFLIDSGAQYQDGTTDITRTIAIGQPTEDMRKHFTAVLKGHIAIATARFPAGTRGIDLDPFARRALWSIGEDFDHGTGHGIGSYLSVHEGPQSISRGGMATLRPGMILSNEPGYYRTGAYGIRIENVVLVTPPENIGGEREMMGFETLTLAPMDRRLIMPELLDASERRWLDGYHARVREQLAPLLGAAERSWLGAATAPLESCAQA